MSWVTFEVAACGAVAVPSQDIMASYDEQTASGFHVLKDTAVQRALMVISAAAEAEAARIE